MHTYVDDSPFTQTIYVFVIFMVITAADCSDNNPFGAGVDLRRQNLASVDVRF